MKRGRRSGNLMRKVWISGLYDMHWRWEGCDHTNKIERVHFSSDGAMELVLMIMKALLLWIGCPFCLSVWS